MCVLPSPLCAVCVCVCVCGCVCGCLGVWVCFLIVITPYKCACIHVLKSVDLLLVMSHKELGGCSLKKGLTLPS